MTTHLGNEGSGGLDRAEVELSFRGEPKPKRVNDCRNVMRPRVAEGRFLRFENAILLKILSASLVHQMARLLRPCTWIVEEIRREAPRESALRLVCARRQARVSAREGAVG